MNASSPSAALIVYSRKHVGENCLSRSQHINKSAERLWVKFIQCGIETVFAISSPIHVCTFSVFIENRENSTWIQFSDFSSWWHTLTKTHRHTQALVLPHLCGRIDCHLKRSRQIRHHLNRFHAKSQIQNNIRFANAMTEFNHKWNVKKVAEIPAHAVLIAATVCYAQSTYNQSIRIESRHTFILLLVHDAYIIRVHESIRMEEKRKRIFTSRF